jgi:integrase
MNRREHGSGSIYFRPPFTNSKGRAKPGIYVISVSMGTDAAGRRVRKALYAATATAARQKLREAVRQQHRGELVAGRRQTVGVFLQKWFKEVVVPHVRPSTAVRYQASIALHLVPPLGHLRLEKLGVAAIQQALNAMAATGIATENDRAVLRNALNTAIRWRLITWNPAQFAEPPRREKRQPRFLTDQEANQFLQTASGDRLEALYILALTTGMREGELLGLTWSHVDLVKREIQVEHQLQRVAGTARLMAVKSQAGRRPIPLADMACDALRAHRERQAAQRVVPWQGLVFPSTVGTPQGARNMIRAFKAVLRKAGLPDKQIRFHDLRHSTATFLLAKGVDPKTVQAILGHTSSRLVMERYGHVLDESRRAAATVMDRTLGGRL